MNALLKVFKIRKRIKSSNVFTYRNCFPARRESADLKLIRRDDVLSGDAVKVACSTGDRCPISPFMHLACFTTFEETVLVHMRNQGRARGWSEKQRIQNLWSKRGYDLIFKACECSCDHGYLRKDTDWVPPWPVPAAVASQAGMLTSQEPLFLQRAFHFSQY